MEVKRRSVVIVAMLLTGCVSMGDRPAEWLSGADPIYPAGARASGVEGFVVVEYRVALTGEVSDVVVVESEPQGVFDASALAAVRTWQFRPAVRDGEDVGVATMRSRLVFKLDSGAYRGY